MVSTPIADLGSTFLPRRAREADSRRFDRPGADSRAPRTGGRTKPATAQPLTATVLHAVLERIVDLTRAETGASTCALLRLTPEANRLQVSVVAGRAPAPPIEPLVMHPLPDAVPVRIEIGASKLAGWLSSIPGYGALLVGWDGTVADVDPGIVEFAARLAAAAIDQDRTGAIDLAAWRFIDSVLGATAGPVLARDASGRLFHISAPAHDLLGTDMRDRQVPLQESAFIQSLDLRDQLDQNIDPSMLPSARLHAGKSAPDLVVSARNRHEGRRWLLLHSEAIRNGNGEITVVLTTPRDFTIVQRHDEAQWLRARITTHLHRRPLDLASIEHDIGAYLSGTCTIHIVTRPDRLPAQPTPTRPWVTTWTEADDTATEMRAMLGHLRLPEPDRGNPSASRATHAVDIPMQTDGEVHAHLVCCRDAHRAGFREDELELLTELADQIGLALAVFRLRESLMTGERQLVEIGKRLQRAEETERRRMALSIHDGLAQVAASVCQQLEVLAERFEPSSDAELRELQRARDLARRTVREARQLISGLRPVTLDTYGLGAAVGEEVETLRREGWTIRYQNWLGDIRLDPEIELDLYRIIQEALSNARKYAQAPEIGVRLELCGTSVRFEVRDRGVGFDPVAAEMAATSGSHVGLGGMRERIARHGGTMRIDSAPSRGTCVRGEVPVHRAGVK